MFGSYCLSVRYDGTAKLQFCSVYVVGKAVSADFVCNPVFQRLAAGVVTRWIPVKNLTFSAEVQWFHLDQKLQGTALLSGTPPKPTARYEYKDQDAVSLNVRVQRNF